MRLILFDKVDVCCPWLIRGGVVQRNSNRSCREESNEVKCGTTRVHLLQNGLQMWSYACSAGSPVRSPCDFSTKAQECSGIVDGELHPPASPSGSPAISLNLPLSLHQPQGIMLMHPATGVLIT